MSFRHTFVTDFIYQASEETKDANVLVESVFKEYAAVLDSKVDERGYGYYSGWFKDLSSYEWQNWVNEVIPKLRNATKVPFRLSILTESGPQITYEIHPK